jgi:hypothetical protein
MKNKTLDFHQIYYEKEQRHELYDFAIPYLNIQLTPYFENSVFRSLVVNSTADLISICSWKLKRKRNAMPTIHVLKENALLSKETILSKDFDVAILTPRLAGHKTLFMSQHWHGQAWVESFSSLSSFLKTILKIEVPLELKYAIYGNHFIAKRDIYLEYVLSCLTPVIEYMEENKLIFQAPSGYRKHKERLGDFVSIQKYEEATKLKDWPICVFLLERLFSIWINSRNYAIVNI